MAMASSFNDEHNQLDLNLSLSIPNNPSNLHDNFDLDLNLPALLPPSNGNNPSRIAAPVLPLNLINYRPPPGRTINNNNNNSLRRTTLATTSKSETIEKPFLWASNKRATVESLIHLTSEGIHTIGGEVQCKQCEVHFHMEFELISSFHRVKNFIEKNKLRMVIGRKAAEQWMNPVLPDCKFCGGKNCVNPVNGVKKRKINWLFLLLGNMLGCCTLKELKYFCKHNKKHRSGAKDRVLYFTYLLLCNQLQPDRLFIP